MESKKAKLLDPVTRVVVSRLGDRENGEKLVKGYKLTIKR